MEERPELIRTDKGLALLWDGMTLRGDFSEMLPRVRPSRLRSELLVKAARYGKLAGDRRPRVLDAAAGLGEDAFLLAAAGFDVLMYERDEMIFALLEDAVKRALGDPETCEAASRMTALKGDSRDAMNDLSLDVNADLRPDIIYLDPMFPARKKSGLIKKKFQILQRLEAPEEGDSLIQAALSACPRRIIVKRPAKAPYLGGIKPGYSIKGDVIRYDCIVLRP